MFKVALERIVCPDEKSFKDLEGMEERFTILVTYSLHFYAKQLNKILGN